MPPTRPVTSSWWISSCGRFRGCGSNQWIPSTTLFTFGPTSQAASVHGFIANHRYLVENVKDWFANAGQWFLDTSATPWTLSYIANPGENPLTDTIVVPQSTQVLSATGLQY